MKGLFADLMKSKTFWTGVSAILGAGGAYSSGDLSAAQAVQLGTTGALGVFLRMAISKIPTQK
jgi:hypothetical protein